MNEWNTSEPSLLSLSGFALTYFDGQTRHLTDLSLSFLATVVPLSKSDQSFMTCPVYFFSYDIM
jgi:hypothetical protein